MQFKAYIDTNILIAYFWSHYYGADNRSSKDIELIKRAFNHEYEMVISTFSSIEIFEHFRDYYIFNKTIKSGYGFREFYRERNEHDLTNKEEKEILFNIDDFENAEGVTLYKIDKITEKYLLTVVDYIKGQVDFKDALHLRTAIELECDFFVTRDAGIRKRYDQLRKREVITESMNMANVSGFLKMLDRVKN